MQQLLHEGGNCPSTLKNFPRKEQSRDELWATYGNSGTHDRTPFVLDGKIWLIMGRSSLLLLLRRTTCNELTIFFANEQIHFLNNSSLYNAKIYAKMKNRPNDWQVLDNSYTAFKTRER